MPSTEPRDGLPYVSLTAVSTIAVRPVKWLWQDADRMRPEDSGRIPCDEFSLVAGREGVAKSTALVTLAADLTHGRLPGAFYGTPRNVIISAREDSFEHTIVPRLMAADADLSRVHRVDVYAPDGGLTGLSLPRDLAGFEQNARDIRAALCILDPLASTIDGKFDSYKDTDVRRALEPLAHVANSAGMAIVGILHVNKSSGQDALSTLMGSRAFAAVARSVTYVMQDPNDEQTRLIGTIKNNLGRVDLPTLTFTVEGAMVAETPEGPVWTGKLRWTGATARTIHDARDEAAEASGDRSATSEAADWLHDYLTAEGGCVDSALAKDAGRKAGHSKDAVQRARKQLGVTSETRGFPRKAYWSLPLASNTSTTPTTTSASTASTGDQSTHWTQSTQSAETGDVASTGDREELDVHF